MRHILNLILGIPAEPVALRPAGCWADFSEKAAEMQARRAGVTIIMNADDMPTQRQARPAAGG